MQPARDGSFSRRLVFPRLPPSVLALCAITIVASLAMRWLLPFGALVPRLFWAGEVWRALTWVFFERQPLCLVIHVAMLVWFGGDLARVWGDRRLIFVYLGFAAGAGVVTCLVALAWPTVMLLPYAGCWSLTEALTIAWAAMFPDRPVLLFLLVRLQGRSLIVATVALTLLWAVYTGFAPALPHLAAEALMLLYMSDLVRSIPRRWARWRLRQSGPRLRIVEDDEEPPPAPPPRWMN